MKKILLLIAFAFMLIACSSDVKKAKEFMASGMYPQAIELLDKVIHEKPAEAHFHLGVCFVNTGNYRGADERFASAVRLKADYGFEIGGAYEKAGLEQIDKNTNTAKVLLERAIHYQPSLKNEICRELITKAQQDMNVLDNCMTICKQFQCDIGTFAEIYYNASQTAEDKTIFLQKAYSLDSKYGPEYAEAMKLKADRIKNPEERLYLLSEAVRISERFPRIGVIGNESVVII